MPQTNEKIKLGLNRVKAALKLFNNPEDSISFIHVAGTNGKGSVCAVLEAILLEAVRENALPPELFLYKGKLSSDMPKIGKYISPHLFDYTERFSINGKNISLSEFETLKNEVTTATDAHNIPLTEFELLTVICFLYFKKNNVKIAIAETGLGGRLDAVNVIKKPLLSIITSISVDHKEFLGDTVEKIAREKAGIIKKNTPAIFLKNNAGYETLKKYAQNIGAKIVTDAPEVSTLPDYKADTAEIPATQNSTQDALKVSVLPGFAIINNEKVPFSLSGDFQAENLKLALIASRELGIPFKTAKSALKNVKWPFRMQYAEFKGQKILIDGCHNPDGARVLAEHIKKYHKKDKIKFIFGCLERKDYATILKTLRDKNFDFCFYEFNYKGALKFELASKIVPMRKILDPTEEITKPFAPMETEKLYYAKDTPLLPENKSYSSQNRAEKPQTMADLTIFAGSLYMLGEIFKNIDI